MRYNLEMKRGDTLRRNFLFYTPSNSPINITASGFKLFIIEKGQTRKTPLITYDTADNLELKIIGTNNVYFELTDEATLDYTHKAIWFQLCQFYPDGSVSTKLEGDIKICS